MNLAIPTLAEIRAGGKPAIARALTLVETAEGTAELARLLDAAAAAPQGEVLGLTGPPGVGKSTLTDALIRDARRAGRSVGVIAVDPSSRVSGGALLGDRTRLAVDPEDDRVFVRSMAARDRLGGLSDHAVAAIVLMRALYDLVIVETVGIGQSESDVARVADTVLLCVQPGAGDGLQFMKAGIMELPDLVVVTKADLGEPARRAVADLATASIGRAGERPMPVVAVSALTGDGFAPLLAAIADHHARLDHGHRRSRRRADQTAAWIADGLTARWGRRGLAALGDLRPRPDEGPFTAIERLSAELERRLFTVR
jgi:LAO/AO transport system kinase